MWIWERKEVYMGLSAQKFYIVRDMLAGSGIPYTYRLVNNSHASFLASRRARTGTFGERNDLSVTYYVYVHKNDYDRACAALKRS